MMEQRFFTAIHKSEDVLKKSSSGGMFTAITDMWLNEYGEKAAIYGCVMDEHLNARHIRATDTVGRDRMRGSKYISSDVSGVFKMVASDLINDLYVVFSGTPCQISGLLSYLSEIGIKKDKQLLTVEVICHGVGSNRFFGDYISHFEKKYKSKAVSCNFRAKSRPGKIQDMEITFENGKKYNASSTKYDWFYSAYTGYILRPACFNCKFAKKERYADISIADNWNKSDSADSKNHSSVVITNSEEGYECFIKSSVCFDFVEKEFEEIHQPNLRAPTSMPQKYNDFWKAYSQGGYLEAQKFLGNNTFKGKIRSLVVDILYKFRLIEKVKRIVGR